MKKLFLVLVATAGVKASAWTTATVNGLTYYVDGSHIAVPIQHPGQAQQFLTVYNFDPQGIHAFQPAANGTYAEMYITANAIYQNTQYGWQQSGCDLATLKQRQGQSYKAYLENATQYWAVYYKTQYLIDNRLLTACKGMHLAGGQ